MSLSGDLRYTLRRFAKRPGFPIAGTLTLALGIGFNAAIFGFVNFLLLRPLPIADPERVMSLDFGRGPILSFPNYIDIRDGNQVFSQVAAMRVAPMHSMLDGTKARLWGYLVTGNYFELLGIEAWRGRLLSESDDLRTGAHPVAVLSHGCWQRRFGGSPDVVGSTMRINGYPFTVVGIAPPGFIGTERFYASEIFVPFSMIREIEGRDWRESRRTSNAWAVARLDPGVSVPRAEASLRALAHELAREHPDENEGLEIRLVPPGLIGDVLRRPVLSVGAGLFLVSGLMLLVACANLSGLFLAQAADRRKEFGLRRSLGASRWALARMVLVESLLLAVAGASFGLVMSVWLGDVVAALTPSLDFPISLEPAMDWRVAAFAGAVALAAAAISTVLPASRSAAVDPSSALKGEDLHLGGRRVAMRDVYVSFQVVVSMVLVASSLMMLRSFQRALSADFGFVAEGGVALRFDLGLHGYTEESGRELQRLLLERLRAIDGIESAGIANSIPFSVDQSWNTVYVEGAPLVSLRRAPSAVTYQATPGFFRAMGTSLLRGRDFEPNDDSDSPAVAIVNETFVEKLLSGTDPIGKRFRFGPEGSPIEIVGVVEAGRYQTITEEPKPAVWRPLAQSYNTTCTVVARSRLPGGETLSMVERSVEALDSDLIVFDAMTLEEYLDLPLTPLRLTTVSLSAMAVLATFLCSLGLYAIVALRTSRRTREIGIRVALGASRGHVLRSVLGRTARLVGIGTIAGTVLALAANRVLASLLYALPEFSVYVLSPAIVVLVSLLACWIPSRRALRIEPLSALRYE